MIELINKIYAFFKNLLRNTLNFLKQLHNKILQVTFEFTKTTTRTSTTTIDTINITNDPTLSEPIFWIQSVQKPKVENTKIEETKVEETKVKQKMEIIISKKCTSISSESSNSQKQ